MPHLYLNGCEAEFGNLAPGHNNQHSAGIKPSGSGKQNCRPAALNGPFLSQLWDKFVDRESRDPLAPLCSPRARRAGG